MAYQNYAMTYDVGRTPQGVYDYMGNSTMGPEQGGIKPQGGAYGNLAQTMPSYGQSLSQPYMGMGGGGSYGPTPEGFIRSGRGRLLRKGSATPLTQAQKVSAYSQG